MKNVKRRIFFVALLFAAAAGASDDAHGAKPGAANGMPSFQMQVRLIKNTLIALNHANVTGNYTVLRDLFSPQMRERLKSSDFSQAFQSSHDRSNRDMSFVMEMQPDLKEFPTFSADNRMRLVGYFPSSPRVLHFDLVFLKTQRGDWWIDGLVIRTEQARGPTRPISQP